MRIAIMQPYLFPYIGYFQLINAVHKFVLYDDVSFINKGWINRNRILLNGRIYTFTLPLKGKSQNKAINVLEIIEPNKQEDLLTTIKHAYSTAPYFNTVYPLLQKVIQFKNNDLS